MRCAEEPQLLSGVSSAHVSSPWDLGRSSGFAADSMQHRSAENTGFNCQVGRSIQSVSVMSLRVFACVVDSGLSNYHKMFKSVWFLSRLLNGHHYLLKLSFSQLFCLCLLGAILVPPSLLFHIAFSLSLLLIFHSEGKE